MCCSSVASDLRQRREVETCAAALNSLSTAAKLINVELWKQQPEIGTRVGYQLSIGGQLVKIKYKDVSISLQSFGTNYYKNFYFHTFYVLFE